MKDYIRARRSIRRFKNRSVPKSLHLDILEAASCAPSPLNLQPWRFVVVRNPVHKAVIRDVYDRTVRFLRLLRKLRITRTKLPDRDTSFLEKADIILPFFEKRVAFARDSLAMASENLMLRAAALGLGTLCLGRPTVFRLGRRRLRRMAGLGSHYDIPYLIAVGYPAEKPKPLARKPLEDMVRFLP